MKREEYISDEMVVKRVNEAVRTNWIKEDFGHTNSHI